MPPKGSSGGRPASKGKKSGAVKGTVAAARGSSAGGKASKRGPNKK